MRAIDPTITDLQALSTARYVLNHRFAGDYTKALEHAHDPYLVNGIICWYHPNQAKPMKLSTFLLTMLTLINLDILALAMLPLTTAEALAVSVVCLGTMLTTIKTAFAA